MQPDALQWALYIYIYIWSKYFNHSAYEKSKGKMAAIDIQ
jgi:hypothetical protein